MRRWNLMARLAVVCLALVPVLGCQDVAGIGLTAGPETVARQWFEAVGAFDVAGMYQVTHPDRRVDLETALENPLVTLGAALGLQERDYFEMEYTLAGDDGQTAQVRATGKFANRLGMIEAVDQDVELRKMDGQWYVWSADGWF